MKSKGNVFWGLILIAAAAVILLNGFGVFGNIDIWKVFLSAILVAVMINGVLNVNFLLLFFPMAFIAILWEQELQITNITPVPVLAAAALLTAGFEMIFGGVRKRVRAHVKQTYYNGNGPRSDAGSNSSTGRVDQEYGEEVICSNSFSGITKYVHSPNLRKVIITNSFGGTSIYLDNAKPANQEIIIDVNNRFGGVEIFVPKEWEVTNDIRCSLGAVDIRPNNSQIVEARVRLVGNVSFGAVEVKFV